jgi:hypothetical protein
MSERRLNGLVGLRVLSGARLFVHRAQAARADIDLASLAILIDRLPLDIDPEHAVRPAL